MHNKEYAQLYSAMKQFLGEDLERGDNLHDGRVGAALSVVAKGISPDFNIESYFLEKLQTPATASSISARFPAITPEKIQVALGR